MSNRKSVEDYSLRKEVRSFDGEDPMLEFLEPLLGSTDAKDWKSYRIINPETDKVLSECVVSVSLQTVVIFTVYLVDDSRKPPVRHTAMRLHEMIVDIWIHAGGKPNGLKYIGIHQIVNRSARTAIQKEFKANGYGPAYPDFVSLDITRKASSTWDQNVFIRSCERSAAALSSRIVGIQIIREREDETDEEQDELFMIMKLA